ncbi:Crp/Fnr family transcriptional regulator [Alteromonadaceae bacterium M269]|nr:Crp/Fnr family transcriptional regulator [Alteromonadaceae bacterium M269]
MLNRGELQISQSNPKLSQIAQMHWTAELKSIIFQKGQVIIQKGQIVSGVYILHSGSLRIYTMDFNGIEKPIDHIRAGEMFLFSLERNMKSLTFPAWLKVDSSQAEIKYVSASVFWKAYADEPHIRDSIIEASLRRIYSMMSVIEKTLVYDVGSRIVHFLLLECLQSRNIKLSHQDIADRVGTSRERVSKYLKLLEKNGFVKLGRMKVIVGSIEELAKLIPKHAL